MNIHMHGSSACRNLENKKKTKIKTICDKIPYFGGSLYGISSDIFFVMTYIDLGVSSLNKSVRDYLHQVN